MIINPNLKVILIGDANVGKTSLLLYLLQQKIDKDVKPTIGVSFIQYDICLPDGSEKLLDIWDTTGDERYKSILPSYFRKTSVAIVCFDVTNKNSFDSVDSWVQMSKTHCGENVKIIIVGTKSELEHVVPQSEVERYCNTNNLDLFYSSAAKGENVVEIFEKAASIATPVETSEQPINLIDMKEKDEDEAPGCC